MSRNWTGAALALAALCLTMPVAGANITQYTNFAQWAAAVNNQYDTEDFNDPGLVQGLSYESDMGGVGNGSFYDAVARAEGFTYWNFGRLTHGFGGSWDLSPGGIGNNLKFVVEIPGEGEVEVFADPSLELTNPFWGIVSDIAFQKMFVTGGSGTVFENPGGSQETYLLDNLVFNGAPGPGGDPGGPGNGEVPEPATMALTASGLLLAALLRKR